MPPPTFMLCPKCGIRASNWCIMRPNELYYPMLCNECRASYKDPLLTQPISWEKSHESIVPF